MATLTLRPEFCVCCLPTTTANNNDCRWLWIVVVKSQGKKKENISSKWCWPCYDKCQPYQKHNLDTLQRRTSSTNWRMEVLLPAGGAIVCRCRLSAWNQYTNRLLIVTINDLATSSTEKSKFIDNKLCASFFFFFRSFVWVILLFLGAKDSFFFSVANLEICAF